MLKEFKQQASSLNINIKKVLVEAYNSVGGVKQYYELLKRVCEILTNELLLINEDVLL